MNNDNLIHQFINDPNYRIASNGSIYTRRCRQGHVQPNWRELAQATKQKYKFITYRRVKLPVHRIIAFSYLGIIPLGFQINHKDGNPANNDLSNLEIVTASENNLHRYRTLGHPRPVGNRKINFEVADQIREDSLLLGLSNSKLRAKYGLSKATISYILNNRIWK